MGACYRDAPVMKTDFPWKRMCEEVRPVHVRDHDSPISPTVSPTLTPSGSSESREVIDQREGPMHCQNILAGCGGPTPECPHSRTSLDVSHQDEPQLSKPSC